MTPEEIKEFLWAVEHGSKNKFGLVSPLKPAPACEFRLRFGYATLVYGSGFRVGGF